MCMDCGCARAQEHDGSPLPGGTALDSTRSTNLPRAQMAGILSPASVLAPLIPARLTPDVAPLDMGQKED